MSSQAPKRIKQDLPEAKCFVFARNPVERSISHYQYLRKSGIINCGFIDAIKIRPDIISNSLYSHHLSKYEHEFGESIKVLNFEDLKSNPEKFASEVFSYLGISYIGDSIAGKERAASEPRSYYLSKAIKNSALLARDIGLENLIGHIKNSDLVNSILYKKLPRSYGKSLKDEYSVYLLDNYFGNEIEIMQKKYYINLGS